MNKCVSAFGDSAKFASRRNEGDKLDMTKERNL